MKEMSNYERYLLRHITGKWKIGAAAFRSGQVSKIIRSVANGRGESLETNKPATCPAI